jgi:hypothetical protein
MIQHMIYIFISKAAPCTLNSTCTSTYHSTNAMVLTNCPGFETVQAEIRFAGREAEEAPVLAGTTAVDRASTLNLNVTRAQGMRHGDKKKRAKRRCLCCVRYHGANPTECMGASRYGKVDCQYYFDDGTQVDKKHKLLFCSLPILHSADGSKRFASFFKSKWGWTVPTIFHATPHLHTFLLMSLRSTSTF